jgi:hypothetical protein
LSSEEAGTLQLLETVNEIAALQPDRRSVAQSNKLAFCFMDRFAPKAFKEARCEWLDAQRERDDFFATIPTVMVMQESEKPRDTFVLKRSAYDVPGARVSPGIPAVLPVLPKQFPDNRLGLLACGSIQSSDLPGHSESILADALWLWLGKDCRRLRVARRVADSSGTAGLAGHTIHRQRLERKRSA